MSHSFSHGQYRREHVSRLSSTGARTRLIDSFTIRQIAMSPNTTVAEMVQGLNQRTGASLQAGLFAVQTIPGRPPTGSV